MNYYSFFIYKIIFLVFFFWIISSCNPTYYVQYDAPENARVYISEDNYYPLYISDTLFFNENYEYLGKGKGVHPIKKSKFEYYDKGKVIIEANNHRVNEQYLNYEKSGHNIKINNLTLGDTLRKRPKTSLKVKINKINFKNKLKEQEEHPNQNVFSHHYQYEKAKSITSQNQIENALKKFLNADLLLREYYSKKKLSFGSYKNIAHLNVYFNLNNKTINYYPYNIYYHYTVKMDFLNLSGDTILSTKEQFTSNNVRNIIDRVIEKFHEGLFNKKMVNSKKNLNKNLNKAIDNWDQLFINSCDKFAHSFKDAGEAVVTVTKKKKHGSGFIIGKAGYILTNQHVIVPHDTVKVITANNHHLKGKVIRSNPYYDLALIKCDTTFKKGINISENKNPDYGKRAFTIGTPINKDLKNSISKGIITGSRNFKNLTTLQTSATVNGGNSGGPLINENGQLMGIVNAKLTGYGIKKMGFAIPHTSIKKALKIELN